MKEILKENRKALLIGYWILFVVSFNLLIVDLGIISEFFIAVIPFVLGYTKDYFDKINDLVGTLYKLTFEKYDDFHVFAFLSIAYICFLGSLLFLKTTMLKPKSINQ